MRCLSKTAILFNLLVNESVLSAMSLQSISGDGRISVERREGQQNGEAKSIKTPQPTDADIRDMWGRHKQKHQIPGDGRFDIFKSNVVAAHDANNQQGVDCTDLFDGEKCVFGITKFSHLSHEEFVAERLGFRWGKSKQSAQRSMMVVKSHSEYITSVDWSNATTPVKDQGVCGSCWAMSATATIESAVFLAGGALQELSVQQIVSCDSKSWGCRGGYPEYAYEYVKTTGGLQKASQYPDTSSATGKDGGCKTSTSTATWKITGYSYVVDLCDSGKCNNQEEFEDTIVSSLQQTGPLTVCVRADQWSFYTSGVFALPACDGEAASLNHCVQLVGYNHESGLPYWIIRNSWGADWGIDGGMYLAKGSNRCGIADYVTSVTVSV